MKVVFIASCSHSGSTLLNLLLARQDRAIGVGESYMLMSEAHRGRYIDHLHERPCTCGTTMDQCPVWSRVASLTLNDPQAPLAKQYQCMLDAITAAHEDTTIVYDSSKYPAALRLIAEAFIHRQLAIDDLQVIHLVKDVRSYAYSRLGRSPSWRSVLRIFKEWYRTNLDIQALINHYQLSHATIGYEALSLFPQPVIGRLCGTLGLNAPNHTFRSDVCPGHIALGNSMQFDETKTSAIYYDYRWFLEPRLGMMYGLMPHIRRYNERAVYEQIGFSDRGSFTPPTVHAGS